MHHTVDRNQVVAESRRLVNDPNVHLTVDVLLHNGKIMKCEQNRTVWLEVGAFLAESYRGYAKKVMASFTDIMQPGLHIMNFSSELTVLLQSTVTHIVVLLTFCSLPGMTSSIVSMSVIMNLRFLQVTTVSAANVFPLLVSVCYQGKMCPGVSCFLSLSWNFIHMGIFTQLITREK